MKELKRKLMLIALVLGISLSGVSLVNAKTWTMEDVGYWVFPGHDIIMNRKLMESDLERLSVSFENFISSDYDSYGENQRATAIEDKKRRYKGYYGAEGYQLSNIEPRLAMIIMSDAERLGYKLKLGGVIRGSSSNSTSLEQTTYPKGTFERERDARVAMIEEILKALNAELDKLK